MAQILYLNQYFTTTLSVVGGINDSQTTGIVLQAVSGLDTTKPGIALFNYADPLNTSIAEWIEFTAINSTTKTLTGVTRGGEGFSAKSHSNGVTVAFPISESHVNRIAQKITGSDSIDNSLLLGQIATPDNPASGKNRVYFKSDDKLYKLTSSGTESEVGGGSSGGQVLDFSNAILPDANFPGISKTVGTNWVYKTLDFDPSTDEACYWNVQIPTDVTPASAKLVLLWTASAGTAAQAAYFDVVTRSLANDEVVDATTTPSTATDSANDALIATGDLHVLPITLTTTGWAAGDLLQIKLSRDANHASDNLNGDVKLIQAFLEIR